MHGCSISQKTLVFDHSSESYQAIFSCGTVYYSVQVVLTFKSVDETLLCYQSMLASELFSHVVLL